MNAIVRPFTAALALALCSTLLLGACAHTPHEEHSEHTPVAADDSLYRALGQRDGIDRLTEALLLQIAGDNRINGYFADTDITRLHRLLTQQFCQLSGGPCQYTGRDMADVHAGMHITSAAFNALVADLITAMNDQSVPLGAQNRLLALLAPMRRQIVGVPQPSSESVGNADDIPRPQTYRAKPLNPGL